ncbi:hypothetical protein LBMAG57_17480 [Verrucomicrobiota bacterium]|nr:hypothetical protein LBMAG57_17480 [Verrucomicrobiota bacterium]
MRDEAPPVVAWRGKSATAEVRSPKFSRFDMQKSSFDIRPRRLHALRCGLRQLDGGEPVLAFIEKTLVHPDIPWIRR